MTQTVETEVEHHNREQRLRRLAERQGLRLQKCRTRNPMSILYGTYQLVDAHTGRQEYGDPPISGGYGLSLDEVERWLNLPPED